MLKILFFLERTEENKVDYSRRIVGHEWRCDWESIDRRFKPDH